MNQYSTENANKKSEWPACIGVEEASKILGWPVYFFPVLVRMGHLKPLGKPAQNSRKWFATAEIERLSRDLAHCCPVNLLLKRTGSLIALTIVNVSGVTDMELGEAFLRSS